MDVEPRVTNLPPWPGAKSCYSRAYRLLERMAANGHVTMGFDMGHPRGRGVDGRPLPLNGCCHPSQEMRDLIDALDVATTSSSSGLCSTTCGTTKGAEPCSESHPFKSRKPSRRPACGRFVAPSSVMRTAAAR